MSEYRIERLTEENLKDLIPLMRDAFGQARTIEGLRRRYDTGVLGAWTIGYIAYHQATDEPAAYYGVFPCRVEFEGQTALAAQSGDTMTHSRHRGKGLFITLAKMTYELARESGVHFIFGFPNTNSYPGFMKHLNWTHRENLRLYATTIPSLPLRRWMTRHEPSRMFYRAYSRTALGMLRGGKVDGFPSSAIDSGIGCLLRDQDYYAYKERSGSFLIQAGGARVWLKIDQAILIGDIEKGAVLDRVLSKLRRIGILLGVRRIIFQTSPETHWDRIFQERFRGEESLPIGWLNLSGSIDPGRVRFTQGDMDIF